MSTAPADPPADPPAMPEGVSWLSVPRPVFSGGNQVQLLKGGDALFPAMHEAIRRARHEVWLATYIFHDDATAMSLVEALVAAHRRGVRVRVVVDGFGSKASLPHLREHLTGHAGHGVALAVFRPMHGWWSWLQPGQMRRLHQKLCSVDGEVAFVGGINVIDDRFDLRHGLSDLPRLDYAVRLQGPVVQAVEQTVRAVWTRAWLGRDFKEELLALARSAEPLVAPAPAHQAAAHAARGRACAPSRAWCSRWRPPLCCATTCASAAPSSAATSPRCAGRPSASS